MTLFFKEFLSLIDGTQARIIHIVLLTKLGSDLSVYTVAISEARPQANSVLTSFECTISSNVRKEN